MVAPALTQGPLPGPAIVQWDGPDHIVMSPTCPAGTLLPGKVSEFHFLLYFSVSQNEVEMIFMFLSQCVLLYEKLL